MSEILGEAHGLNLREGRADGPGGGAAQAPLLVGALLAGGQQAFTDLPLVLRGGIEP